MAADEFTRQGAVYRLDTQLNVTEVYRDRISKGLA